jgi:hypothetical protein
MRKHFSIGAMSALAAALCVAQGAHAAIVGFDDIPIPGSYQSFFNNFYDGGLHFKEDQFAVMPLNFTPHPSGQQNQFMEAGNYAAEEPITLAAYTGAIAPDGTTNNVAFNLWYLKIGLGDGNLGGIDSVIITGDRPGCTSDCPYQKIDLTNHFQLVTLLGFTDVTSVTINQQITSGGTRDIGWLGFDDFSYTAFNPEGPNPPGEQPSAVPAANVPEPSAWALLIVGFGGVGALMRRNRRQGLAAA